MRATQPKSSAARLPHCTEESVVNADNRGFPMTDVLTPQTEKTITLKDSRLFRQHCYINGEWVDADGKSTFEVLNPADETLLGHVPNMGSNETRRAIEAANAAWPAWRAKTARERAAVMRRWF